MKELFIIFDELNKYSSLILMFATLVYVYFTYKLTKETTKLREVETTPFISIYIKPDHFLKLIIENIGKSPAYDVKFEMDEKYKQYFKCGCDFKRKISYFSPNQRLIIGMDAYTKLSKLDFDYIPIKVKYYSKNNDKYEETFFVEWKYLSGTSLKSNALEEIPKELEKISSEIKNLNNIVKNKEYFITNKLKILEFEKKDELVNLVFSNGKLINIPTKEFIDKININDIEYIHAKNGDLLDYTNGDEYLAEEIYDKLNYKKENNEHTKI